MALFARVMATYTVL